MKKAWNELTFSEKAHIAFNYGSIRYIREYYEEQEKRQRMMATVDTVLRLCNRASRRHHLKVSK